MARILVRYYGILRELSKKKEDKIEISDEYNILDLIKRVSEKNGQKFRDLVFDDETKLRDGLAFAIDAVSVERSKLEKIKCRDASEFVILPPISGGHSYSSVTLNVFLS
jgi:molybdopterin converting factor small subunit